MSETEEGAEQTKIAKMQIYLRYTYRIKHGCDYAVSEKHGNTYLMCLSVFEPTIVEVAYKYGVTFTSIFTY